MNKLWYANLLRLRKNKCFWGCMLLMVMMAVYIPVMRYLQMKETGYINRLDVGFLMFIACTDRIVDLQFFICRSRI